MDLGGSFHCASIKAMIFGSDREIHPENLDAT